MSASAMSCFRRLANPGDGNQRSIRTGSPCHSKRPQPGCAAAPQFRHGLPTDQGGAGSGGQIHDSLGQNQLVASYRVCLGSHGSIGNPRRLRNILRRRGKSRRQSQPRYQCSVQPGIAAKPGGDSRKPVHGLGRFSDGFPTNVFSLPAAISFRTIVSNFRNPLVHKWNLLFSVNWGKTLRWKSLTLDRKGSVSSI